MKIKYIQGDIFESETRYILHGCNAQGVMGAGVAKAIKQTYPYAFEVYRKAYDTNGLRLGETQIAKCRNRTIINAITQNTYGTKKDVRYVSYDAIAMALHAVEEILYGSEIAMPMIGAGLGGGDWNVIEAIIESECKTIQPIVFTLDK